MTCHGSPLRPRCAKKRNSAHDRVQGDRLELAKLKAQSRLRFCSYRFLLWRFPLQFCVFSLLSPRLPISESNATSKMRRSDCLRSTAIDTVWFSGVVGVLLRDILQFSGQTWPLVTLATRVVAIPCKVRTEYADTLDTSFTTLAQCRSRMLHVVTHVVTAFKCAKQVWKKRCTCS